MRTIPSSSSSEFRSKYVQNESQTVQQEGEWGNVKKQVKVAMIFPAQNQRQTKRKQQKSSMNNKEG